jgi:hypothetical protein
MENVTAVRFIGVSLFAPGDLRSVYFLGRTGADGWNTIASTRIVAWAQDHKNSYVNRALALFRHIAGIPTDQEPPAAR